MIRKLSSRIIRRSQRSPRRGVIVLEFLLAMPLIIIATIAIFEFGFLALIQQMATMATIESGREGAKQFSPTLPFDVAGANNDICDQIVKVVNQYLNVQHVEIADPANGFPDTTKANAVVLIERGDGASSFQTAQRGTAPSQGFSRTGPAASPTEIVVTISFPLVDASNPKGYGNPLPDWLSLYGFSFSKYTFEMSSRASLE